MTEDAPARPAGYRDGFAELYARHFTGWTEAFCAIAEPHLRAERTGDALLDLACGSGPALEHFARAGWSATGVDASPSMLAWADRRLAGLAPPARPRLVQAPMTELALDHPVDAVVCLEGALNHLTRRADLDEALGRVAGVLRAGGRFVFDLYEPHHFRGWNAVRVTDEPDLALTKRGVWDDDAGFGMLRFSGAIAGEAGWAPIGASLSSRVYPAAAVHDALDRAGLEPRAWTGEVPACGCGRSSTGACRTVYEARRR